MAAARSSPCSTASAQKPLVIHAARGWPKTFSADGLTYVNSKVAGSPSQTTASRPERSVAARTATASMGSESLPKTWLKTSCRSGKSGEDEEDCIISSIARRRRAGLFRPANAAGAAGHAGHRRDELRRLDGLRDVHLEPVVQRARAIFRAGERRERDRRHRAPALLAQRAHALDELEAVHVGHPDVADEDVRTLALDEGQRLLRARGLQDLRLAVLQHAGHELAGVGLV